MAVKSDRSRVTDLLAPVLLVLVGAAFRFWDLASLPPGIFYDEAANGIDALRVLSGWHPVFFPGDQGREPLFIYLQAATMAVIGPSPLALRLPAAVVGILTIPIVYVTFRQFGGQSVGLLGAALVATSYWMVSLSRLAFRTNTMPLLLCLAVYWLWKALRSGRLGHWALSGAFLGLALYSYIPARLAPALVGIWLLVLLVRSGVPDQSRRQILLGSVVLAGVFLLVTLPLGRYFWLHQNEFIGRVEAAAKPGLGIRDVPAGYLRAVEGLVWSGDPNPRQDLPGLPLLDVTTTLAGMIGAVVALRKRDPAALFCVAWSAAMIIAAALGDEPAHALRLAGILPFVFYLPARGFAALATLRPRLGWLVWTVVLLAGLASARDYFVVWANRPDVPPAFEADLLRALRLGAQVPPGAPLFVTSDVYAGQPFPLVFFPQLAPVARGFDGRNTFVTPAASARPVYYVYATTFEPPGGILDRDQLSLVATTQDPSGRIAGALYRSKAALHPPVPTRDAAATIAGAVKVVGADVPSVLRPGQTVRVALHWTVAGRLPPGHWEFFAHLVGRNGETLLAQDYNQGFPPTQWRSGDRVISWFDLRVPDDAPAEVADVVFGIFDPETGQQLAVTRPDGAAAGNAVTVGPTRINRPTAVPPPEYVLSRRFGAHLILDGYDLNPRPDGSLVLQLHWHADGPVAKDYTVFAHRLDPQGKFLVAADGQPDAGRFPTSTWQPNEEVLDSHVLPPAARGVQIEFGLYLLATGQRLPVVDGTTSQPLGNAVRISATGG